VSEKVLDFKMTTADGRVVSVVERAKELGFCLEINFDVDWTFTHEWWSPRIECIKKSPPIVAIEIVQKNLDLFFSELNPVKEKFLKCVQAELPKVIQKVPAIYEEGSKCEQK